MALKDLFFTIFAKDKTGPAFDGVNRRFKETETRAERLKRRLDGIGRSMRNVGAAGTVGSAGIAAVFRGSIDLYDQQARSEAKVRQGIKATGAAAGFAASELFKQASAMQAVTRFGDEDILNNVTAQFLTFKNVTGETFQRAQWGALDLATVLDGDLKSASIMLGKALNDPVKGLSAMSRAGVTFSADQQQVIKDLAKTGRIAEAQKMILDEIASAYGGQAKAAAEAGAGVRDQWRNTFGDVKEIFGGVLLEGMKAILPTLQSLAEGFQNMEPGAQKFVVITTAMAAILPPLVASLGVFVIAVGAISAPVLAGVAAVTALTAGLVAFWPEIKAGATVVQESFAAIGGYITGTVDRIVEVINGKFVAIMDKIGQKVEWVEGKFFWLYDKVVGNSWVPDLVEEIGQSFALLQGNMVDPTNKATEEVNDKFRTLMGDVTGNLRMMADQGKITFKGFLGALESAANSHVDRMISDTFSRLSDAAAESLAGKFGGGGGGGGGGFFGNLISAGAGLLGVPGFDTGGAFTVRGRAGIDRNMARVRLSDGERVEVIRRGQGGGRTVNLTMNIQTADAESFRRSRAQIAAEARGMLAFAERGA